GRGPARVVGDLAQGVVTPAAAASVYGVVVADGAVDEAATLERRRRLAAARVTASLSLTADRDETQTRIIALDAATARRLGVARGDVVELVNPGGAPARCWVGSVHEGASRRAGVSAVTLSMVQRPPEGETESWKVRKSLNDDAPGLKRASR